LHRARMTDHLLETHSVLEVLPPYLTFIDIIVLWIRVLRFLLVLQLYTGTHSDQSLSLFLQL